MANYSFTPSALTQAVQQTILFKAATLAKAGVFVVSELLNDIKNVKLDQQYAFDTDISQSAIIGNPTNKIVTLRFEPTTYIKNDGVFLTDVLEVLACDISVMRKNDIIRTRVINEESTIKEIFSRDDYQINISGILIGNLGVVNNLDYFKLKPEKDIINLVNICNSNNAVVVTCPYLNEYFDIDSIIIDSFELQDEQELKNIQRFSLKAYSHNQKLYI